MISDSTHPKTRVSNSRVATEVRAAFCVRRLREGANPKSIADETHITENATRTILNRAGYHAIYISEAEHAMVLAGRRALA